MKNERHSGAGTDRARASVVEVVVGGVVAARVTLAASDAQVRVVAADAEARHELPSLPPIHRACAHCGLSIRSGRRADSRFCSSSCRTLAWRARREAARGLAMGAHGASVADRR